MKKIVYLVVAAGVACAQPVVLDPTLGVRTAATGLALPTSMAFLGANNFLVLEKETGKVQRVVNGVVQPTPAIDLAVNSASERGLLGIALDPNFSSNRWVYLYWTCKGTAPVAPAVNSCTDPPATGEDTTDILQVPLLGNRVDRFLWNGTTLTYVQNIIKLHAYQNDPTNMAPAGNHNGGVIRFGPDGKLYIIIGDNGRRGALQNLPFGPRTSDFGALVPDDPWGGPDPDNAHLTGVILRLNPDGTTPRDNPFFDLGAQIPGQIGANFQKIFAYGIRNSFGMTFDPITGDLWQTENGDDVYDEINRVTAGFNSGWIQFMGPASRLNQFKDIEMNLGNGQLQQLRFPPTLLADNPLKALSRLSVLPNSHFDDPVFSWKYALAPAALGFIASDSLGAQFQGDLLVGASRITLEGGYLFRFNMNTNRRSFVFFDSRLEDNVADNLAKFDISESEPFLFGRNFGVVTDIQTGPNGNVYLVSLSDGKVYEIFRAP